MNMADLTNAELTAAVNNLRADVNAYTARVTALETAGVTPLPWYKDSAKVLVTLTAIVGILISTTGTIVGLLNNRQISTVSDKAVVVESKVDAAKAAADDTKTTTLAHAEKVETDLTKIKTAVKTNGDGTPSTPSPAPAPVLDDRAAELRRMWNWFQDVADRSKKPADIAKAADAKKLFDDYQAKGK
jgi:hypothetical protein